MAVYINNTYQLYTEYISAATAAEEIVWIINHLKNFDLQ